MVSVVDNQISTHYDLNLMEIQELDSHFSIVEASNLARDLPAPEALSSSTLESSIPKSQQIPEFTNQFLISNAQNSSSEDRDNQDSGKTRYVLDPLLISLIYMDFIKTQNHQQFLATFN